jgi:hypothetical protein
VIPIIAKEAYVNVDYLSSRVSCDVQLLNSGNEIQTVLVFVHEVPGVGFHSTVFLKRYAIEKVRRIGYLFEFSIFEENGEDQGTTFHQISSKRDDMVDVMLVLIATSYLVSFIFVGSGT